MRYKYTAAKNVRKVKWEKNEVQKWRDKISVVTLKNRFLVFSSLLLLLTMTNAHKRKPRRNLFSVRRTEKH